MFRLQRIIVSDRTGWHGSMTDLPHLGGENVQVANTFRSCQFKSSGCRSLFQKLTFHIWEGCFFLHRLYWRTRFAALLLVFVDMRKFSKFRCAFFRHIGERYGRTRQRATHQDICALLKVYLASEKMRTMLFCRICYPEFAPFRCGNCFGSDSSLAFVSSTLVYRTWARLCWMSCKFLVGCKIPGSFGKRIVIALWYVVVPQVVASATSSMQRWLGVLEGQGAPVMRRIRAYRSKAGIRFSWSSHFHYYSVRLTVVSLFTFVGYSPKYAPILTTSVVIRTVSHLAFKAFLLPKARGVPVWLLYLTKRYPSDFR